MDGHQLTLYATWLVLSGRLKAAGSVRQYISAVSVLHAEKGLSCPTPAQYGPLAQVIKGFRRLAQRPTKKSLPINPPILMNLLTSTSHPLSGIHTTILTVFRSFTLLLYQSMLRTSNMVPPNRREIDLDMILTWGNVKRLQGGVVLLIKKSKTIQNGERIHEVPLAASDDFRLCPVLALSNLASLYGPNTCGPRTPVFRLPTASGSWTIMAKSDYVPYFRNRIAKMGLKPEAFSMHGFRHGSIQELLLSEGNLALCKLTSDHSSDAILSYHHVPAERRLRISEKVNRRLAANLPRIA